MLLDGLGERALGELVTQTAFSINIGTGTYTLTVESVMALRTRLSKASAGLYALTGENVVEKKTSLLNAQAGFYVLTGNSLGLSPFIAFAMSIGTGSYSVTGETVKALKGYAAFVGSGPYALTGESDVFKKTSILNTAGGAYALTGKSLSLAVPSTSFFAAPSQPRLFGLDYNPTIKGIA